MKSKFNKKQLSIKKCKLEFFHAGHGFEAFLYVLINYLTRQIKKNVQ